MTHKFYFNPETIDAYKNASAKEKYDFIRYECEWHDEDDFTELLNDFNNQTKNN
jgi:hypothetical protein